MLRLDHSLSGLETSEAALVTARSQIEDGDYAQMLVTLSQQFAERGARLYLQTAAGKLSRSALEAILEVPARKGGA